MRFAAARLLAVALVLLASRVASAVQDDFSCGASSSAGGVPILASDSMCQVEVRCFSGLAPGSDGRLTSRSSARVDQHAGSGLQVQCTSANDLHADIPAWRRRPESCGDWNGSSGLLASQPKGAELLRLDFDGLAVSSGSRTCLGWGLWAAVLFEVRFVEFSSLIFKCEGSV